VVAAVMRHRRAPMQLRGCHPGSQTGRSAAKSAIIGPDIGQVARDSLRTVPAARRTPTSRHGTAGPPSGPYRIRNVCYKPVSTAAPDGLVTRNLAVNHVTAAKVVKHSHPRAGIPLLINYLRWHARLGGCFTARGCTVARARLTLSPIMSIFGCPSRLCQDGFLGCYSIKLSSLKDN
jgi:hypothetical protein